MENKTKLLVEVTELKKARTILTKLIKAKMTILHPLNAKKKEKITEHTILIQSIGRPLIDFLDLNILNCENFGYIERRPLYLKFIKDYKKEFTSFEKKVLYNSSQKFKIKVEQYCQLRSLVFNPEEKLNGYARKRIMKKSKAQTDKHGNFITSEYFFIDK